MELFALLNLDGLSLGMSRLSMYPYFDSAHYIVSVMALKEQPGAVEVARRSPFACWFSAMLYCFGGAILSGLLLAEPALACFSNTSNVLLASVIWYLVFYSPQDLVYKCASFLPVRLVLTGMKEMTRTWKVLGGVTQAGKQYKEGWLVMIAVGWAKGAGGGLISNFEQLVRGIWRPETNELLNMSYPTKVTLLGAVLFTLQQSQYLPVAKHNLMFIYTIFIVVNKVRMMLTRSTASPFAPLEAFLYQLLFASQPEETKTRADAQVPVRSPSRDTCSAPKKDVVASVISRNGSAVPETNGYISCVPEANGNGAAVLEKSDKDTTVSKNQSNKKCD